MASGRDARIASVIRGPLTADEKAEIERLTTIMKNPKPGPIARRLNRHPATIHWHMLRHGQVTQPVRTISQPYTTRAGITKYGWSPEQDRRLEELLAQGLKCGEVARILTDEFGIPRNRQKCNVRSVLLAASEGSELPTEEAA